MTLLATSTSRNWPEPNRLGESEHLAEERPERQRSERHRVLKLTRGRAKAVVGRVGGLPLGAGEWIELVQRDRDSVGLAEPERREEPLA